MTKKFFLISLLLTIIRFGYSEGLSRQTDSLIHCLEKLKPEQKPAILNQIAQSFLPANPQKCLDFAEKAADLSKKSKNAQQLALACKNTGAAYYNLYQFDDALKAYNQSIEQFNKINKQQQVASVYINIGLVYREKNSYTEAGQFFIKAFNISKTINDQPGQANALNMAGSLALKQNKLDAALKNYTEALAIRQILKKPADIASSYSNVALVYKELNQFDKALEFNQKALDLRTCLKIPGPIANTLNDIGNVYWQKREWDKALEHYFRSIKIRYETGDKAEVANSYQNIGNLFARMGNLNKAREYFLLAFNIYTETGDMRKLAGILTLLGNTESSSKKYTEALDYYNKALEFRRKIGEKKDIAASYNNLGNIYTELNQTTQALKYFNEALTIRQKINDLSGEITTLNDLGNLYEKNGNNVKAQASFESAMKLARQTSNLYYTGLCARKLAVVMLRQSNLPRALELLDIAHDASQKLNNAELHKNIHLALYDYYNRKKEFEKALDNYLQYNIIDDSIQTTQNNLKLLGIQQNLELEKKSNDLKQIESEIKLLRQEKTMQAILVGKQRYMLISLGILCLFAIIIAGLIYNRNLARKKHNLELQQQNAIIEEANTRLKQSEAELTSLNATKDKYFSIIAHDIRNPLSSLLNLSQIITEKFESLNPSDIQSFTRMIHDSASNLNNLLENLLNWARANTNRLQFSPQTLKLYPVANSICLLNKLTSAGKDIKISNEVSTEIGVFADQHMLTLVLRNLVSNALKFTPEGGTITLSAKEYLHTVEISVTDTGVGIASENIEKLFRLDTHFTTRGTGNEQGTGLGLILVKEFVEKNNGKIWVTSEPNKGSTFTFTLPKHEF
ncbi:MAG: tetratricopeptide repeat protein [Bacteroidota bacterium]|nr:tetratricopeptide repeat protein [Bacteroidota bacterium]